MGAVSGDAMKTKSQESDAVLARAVKFTRTGDMLLPLLPLVLALAFGGAAAAGGRWDVAAGIAIVSVLVFGFLLKSRLKNRRGLNLAFGSAKSEVVWVFAKRLRKEEVIYADTVSLGLSDGSMSRVRLPSGVTYEAVGKALADRFPNAVFGFREEFPAAFQNAPLAFREKFTQEYDGEDLRSSRPTLNRPQ